MSRPLPLSPPRLLATKEHRSRPAPVAIRLPYFPPHRARQLDAHASCSSIETVMPLPHAYDADDADEEIFALTDEEDDHPLSEPEEPLTSSSLSTENEPRRRDSLLSLPKTTRRVTSAVTLPGLVSSAATLRPATPHSKSIPCSPTLTPTVALGTAGELTVPALVRPSMPRRSPSASFLDMGDGPSRTARVRGWTFSNALPAIATYFGLSPSVPTPASFALPSPSFSPRSAPPSPLLQAAPAYVSRIEVSFNPSSPAGRACRQLIIKLRRLSDTTALSPGSSSSVSLFSRPPRIVTTLLPPADATASRVRVIYSNSVKRDFDPSIGALAIIKEIEQTTRSFSTLS